MLLPQLWVLFVFILHFPLSIHASEDLKSLDATIKSSVFLSPPFFLRPGSVVDKYYFDIPFPKGHIALKSFDAEVVDEMGTPIPLYETYLHHWAVEPYYGQKGATSPRELNAGETDLSKILFKRNDGVCKGTLTQYYGIGSETRKLSTWVPGNYGIEVAKSEDVPEGYEPRWMLNVHAIDTRGADDRLGCTECKCSLYNVTMGKHGRPIAKDYIGGLLCCYDQTQCLVKDGFNGAGRKLYLRYRVRWADWDDSFVPVKIYIFDATDSRKLPNDSTDGDYRSCKVYSINPILHKYFICRKDRLCYLSFLHETNYLFRVHAPAWSAPHSQPDFNLRIARPNFEPRSGPTIRWFRSGCKWGADVFGAEHRKRYLCNMTFSALIFQYYVIKQ